jgi:hypothetical protein
MSVVDSTELLERLEQKLEALLQREVAKAYYTVDEFATLVGRRPFTVRQWCNLGRINAERSMTQTGPSLRWAISHEEYLRFQREGLLPLCGLAHPRRSDFTHSPRLRTSP